VESHVQYSDRVAAIVEAVVAELLSCMGTRPAGEEDEAGGWRALYRSAGQQPKGPDGGLKSTLDVSAGVFYLYPIQMIVTGPHTRPFSDSLRARHPLPATACIQPVYNLVSASKQWPNYTDREKGFSSPNKRLSFGVSARPDTSDRRLFLACCFMHGRWPSDAQCSFASYADVGPTPSSPLISC
jgi:hypothetical protein